MNFKLYPMVPGDLNNICHIGSAGFFQLLGEKSLFTEAEKNKWSDEFDAKFSITVIKDWKAIIVGFCGFRHTNYIAKTAQVVLFSIGPSFGSDVKTSIPNEELLQMAEDQAFGKFNFEKISICLAEDDDSIKIFEVCGWVVEGVKRSNICRKGVPINQVVLSLLKSEWRKK